MYREISGIMYRGGSSNGVVRVAKVFRRRAVRSLITRSAFGPACSITIMQAAEDDLTTSPIIM
jgi:hypothetical protein